MPSSTKKSSVKAQKTPSKVEKTQKQGHGASKTKKGSHAVPSAGPLNPPAPLQAKGPASKKKKIRVASPEIVIEVDEADTGEMESADMEERRILQEENVGLLQEMARLREEFTSLHQENDWFTTQLSHIRSSVVAERQAPQDESSVLMQEMARLREQVASLHNENARLNTELHQIRGGGATRGLPTSGTVVHRPPPNTATGQVFSSGTEVHRALPTATAAGEQVYASGTEVHCPLPNAAAGQVYTPQPDSIAGLATNVPCTSSQADQNDRINSGTKRRGRNQPRQNPEVHLLPPSVPAEVPQTTPTMTVTNGGGIRRGRGRPPKNSQREGGTQSTVEENVANVAQARGGPFHASQMMHPVVQLNRISAEQLSGQPSEASEQNRTVNQGEKAQQRRGRPRKRGAAAMKASLQEPDDTSSTKRLRSRSLENRGQQQRVPSQDKSVSPAGNRSSPYEPQAPPRTTSINLSVQVDNLGPTPIVKLPALSTVCPQQGLGKSLVGTVSSSPQFNSSVAAQGTGFPSPTRSQQNDKRLQENLPRLPLADDSGSDAGFPGDFDDDDDDEGDGDLHTQMHAALVSMLECASPVQSPAAADENPSSPAPSRVSRNLFPSQTPRPVPHPSEKEAGAEAAAETTCERERSENIYPVLVYKNVYASPKAGQQVSDSQPCSPMSPMLEDDLSNISLHSNDRSPSNISSPGYRQSQSRNQSPSSRQSLSRNPSPSNKQSPNDNQSPGSSKSRGGRSRDVSESPSRSKSQSSDRSPHKSKSPDSKKSPSVGESPATTKSCAVILHKINVTGKLGTECATKPVVEKTHEKRNSQAKPRPEENAASSADKTNTQAMPEKKAENKGKKHTPGEKKAADKAASSTDKQSTQKDPETPQKESGNEAKGHEAEKKKEGKTKKVKWLETEVGPSTQEESGPKTKKKKRAEKELQRNQIGGHEENAASAVPETENKTEKKNDSYHQSAVRSGVESMDKKLEEAEKGAKIVDDVSIVGKRKAATSAMQRVQAMQGNADEEMDSDTEGPPEYYAEEDACSSGDDYQPDDDGGGDDVSSDSDDADDDDDLSQTRDRLLPELDPDEIFSQPFSSRKRGRPKKSKGRTDNENSKMSGDHSTQPFSSRKHGHLKKSKSRTDDKKEQKSGIYLTNWVLKKQKKVPKRVDDRPKEGIFMTNYRQKQRQHAEVKSTKAAKDKRQTPGGECDADRRVKTTYCLFCKKPSAKLVRHLQAIHKDEEEVVIWLAEHDPKQKRLMYLRMRNLGNYLHNSEVLRKGYGEFRVSKFHKSSAPNSDYVEVRPEDYTVCPFCFDYYKKEQLWRHIQHTCPFPSQKARKNWKKSELNNTVLLACPLLAVSLSSAPQDSIMDVVKGDELILKFGESCFRSEKDARSRINVSTVLQKVRMLAMLVTELQNLSGKKDCSLEGFLESDWLDVVAEAVKTVAKDSRNTQEGSSKVGTLQVIGAALSACCNIVTESTEQESETAQKVASFVQSCEESWPNICKDFLLEIRNAGASNGRSASKGDGRVDTDKQGSGDEASGAGQNPAVDLLLSNTQPSPHNGMEAGSTSGLEVSEDPAASAFQSEERQSRNGKKSPAGADDECDGANSTGSERDGANNTGSERDGANSTGSERDGANNTGSERDGANNTGSERDGANNTGSERDGANNTGSERDGANNTGSERDGANSTGSERDGANNTGSERDGANNTGSERDGVNNTGSATHPKSSAAQGSVSDQQNGHNRENAKSHIVLSDSLKDIWFPFAQNSEEDEVDRSGQDTDGEEEDHGIRLSCIVGESKTKSSYCLYCRQPREKMKRHFATVHSNEKEVAELLQETDQKRRLLRVQQLRNLGNHLHNISVLKKGRGRFVIARRPNTQHSSTTSELVKQYHPCVYCYGYYAKFQYWRHSKKCALKPGNWESLDRDTVSHSLLPFDKDLQARVGLVLSQCRSDRVTRVIQRDRIIIKVLECKMRRTRSNNKGALGAVRTSIRHLGKLVLELRNLTGERDAFLEDFFNVSKVDQLFEALMLTAEECGRHRFLKSIHTMLNSGITFLLAESIEARDSAKEESIRSFDRTFQSKWDDLYSTLKVLNLEEEKRTLFELKLAPHSAGESAGKQQKASEPVENSEAAPENGEQSAAELADQLRLLCDEEQNGEDSAAVRWLVDAQWEAGDTADASVEGLVDDSQQNKAHALVEGNGADADKKITQPPTQGDDTGTEDTDITLEEEHSFRELKKPAPHQAESANSEGTSDFSVGGGANKTTVKRFTFSDERLKELRARMQAYSESSSDTDGSDSCEDDKGQQSSRKKHRKNKREKKSGLKREKSNKTKSAPQRTYWTDKEREAIFRQLGELINQDKVPGAKHIRQCLNAEVTVLGQRSVASVRSFCVSEIKKKSRQPSKMMKFSCLEKEAIHRQLGKFIERGQLPGKGDVLQCLKKESAVLGAYSWKRVKNFCWHAMKRTTSVRNQKRVTWSGDEQEAVFRQLGNFIELGTVPGKKDIERCMMKESVLSHRSWKNIKDFCRNTTQKIQKSKN